MRDLADRWPLLEKALGPVLRPALYSAGVALQPALHILYLQSVWARAGAVAVEALVTEPPIPDNYEGGDH